MKLIVSATTDTLEMLLEKAIDGVIFPVRGHAMRYGETFDADKIEEYVKRAHAKGKKAYLSMNAIHHEPELASLESTFESLSKIPFDALYFADLAVYEIADDYGLVHKLIYYPETYVTSDLDMRFWAEQSVKSAVLSREMTLEDIKVISQESPIGVSIIGHGYLNMFHSKRRLIKTFLNYTKRHPTQSSKRFVKKNIPSIRMTSEPTSSGKNRYQASMFSPHSLRLCRISSLTHSSIRHKGLKRLWMTTSAFKTANPLTKQSMTTMMTDSTSKRPSTHKAEVRRDEKTGTPGARGRP